MKKVSMFELVALSVTVVTSTSVMFSPYLAAQVSRQDSWVAVLAAGLLSIIPAVVSVALMAKFPGQSFTQALPELLGAFLGKVVSVLYAALFLFLAALTVWRLEAFGIRFLLPETPQAAVRILFLLAVAYAAMAGTIPLMRTNAYIVAFQVLVPLFAVILSVSRADFSFLFPVFEQGVRPAIDTTVLLLGWFCQAPLVIVTFQWLVGNTKKGGLKAVLGALATTVAAAFGFIGILTALGPEQAATTYYPAYTMVRIITVSTFLEHTEVIFVAVWLASIYLAAAFFIQAFAGSISDTFNIKGKSGKTWTVFATILALAIWPFFHRLSFFNLISIIRDYGSPAGVIFGGIIPLLLYLRVLIAPPKQKKSQQKGANSGGDESAAAILEEQ